MHACLDEFPQRKRLKEIMSQQNIYDNASLYDSLNGFDYYDCKLLNIFMEADDYGYQ